MADTSRLSDALMGYAPINTEQDFANAVRARLAQALGVVDSLAPKTNEQAGEMAAYAVPVLGQALSARDAYNAANEGDWRGTALGALGAIPFIGGMTAPLKGTGERLAQAMKGGLSHDYGAILSDLGPSWANAPVIGADGTVLHNAVSGGSVGGPAVFLHPDGSVRKGIIAYHGSPHNFERFDMSKIGTGEGAQAYGHGLYFAESEPVARSYRDQLSGTNWHPEYSQALLDEGRLKGELARLDHTMLDESLQQGSKPKNDGWGTLGADILPDVAKKYQPEVERLNGELARVRERMQTVPQTVENPGHMYEVNINADPEHFLDWDKPLSEQSPEVLTKIGQALGQPNLSKHVDLTRQIDEISARPYAGPELSSEWKQAYDKLKAERAGLGVDPHITGQKGGQLYEKLDSQAASNSLREAGIPGIKYLDQGSRAAGEGSRNYVVFSDDLVSIVRKYGIPGAISMGLLTQDQGDALAAQGY